MFPPVAAPAADAFTLAYHPDQRLLVARWLQPLELPELKASYEAILSTALANGNCRHWLLDVRRRPIGNTAGLEWFRREFGPRLVGALGGPLFVAYFSMITQAATTDIWQLQASIEEGERGGAHYHYFNLEAEALAWLASRP